MKRGKMPRYAMIHPHRSLNRKTTLCAALMIALAGVAVRADGPPTGGEASCETFAHAHHVPLTVRTRTGGGLTGTLLDCTEHGLVILSTGVPYVFAWTELEAGNAYATRRSLLSSQRGGANRLTAGDHYRLGVFALGLDRPDLGRMEFRVAKRLDRQYAAPIEQALAAFRAARDSLNAGTGTLVGGGLRASTVRLLSSTGDAREPRHALSKGREPQSVESDFAQLPGLTAVPGPSPKRRAAVREVYLRFGKKVQETLGAGITLLETDHFLIWTDWEPRYRTRLATWCESMYAALCARFGLDAEGDVFLAKCPMFVWRSEARFRKFAQYFDGYDGVNAIGYTRSIEENGHVHVVLTRRGRSRADFQRTACTLVHEGTHAFVHRLFSSRLIPQWVNEGFADLMAERVLGNACPNGENAALLARQFVRYDWPIADLLRGIGPIAIHQYPLAHSVIAFLETRGPKRLAGLIEDLKAGKTFAAALANRYDGLTLEGLEAQWREAVRASDPRNRTALDPPGPRSGQSGQARSMPGRPPGRTKAHGAAPD